MSMSFRGSKGESVRADAPVDEIFHEFALKAGLSLPEQYQ
jgi:hypothetical protein